MTTAPCTRCGSLIHSSEVIQEGVTHVICTGCDFEWVE